MNNDKRTDRCAICKDSKDIGKSGVQTYYIGELKMGILAHSACVEKEDVLTNNE